MRDEHDTVARLGGDEFAIVQFGSDCEPSAEPRSPASIVERITAPYDDRRTSARHRRQHRHLAGAWDGKIPMNC